MASSVAPLTYAPDPASLRAPFDVAVIIPTILRPTLLRAVRSVFSQRFDGRIQVLVGIDRAQADRSLLQQLASECPASCAVTVMHLGYSTAVRNGGLYPAGTGGALRTILSFAANSRLLAYLDDDNWWAEDHLATLRDAICDKEWAFSLRYFVDEANLKIMGVDVWESVGPGTGVFQDKFGGFVDPSCLMMDRFACHSVLAEWSYPLESDSTGMSSDRTVFAKLRNRPFGATNKPTAYYVMHSSDINHELRLQRLQTFS